MRIVLAIAVLGFLTSNTAMAQQRDDLLCKPTLAPRADGPQVADDAFNPDVRSPAFPTGRGPRVLLDEGHSNFHTVDGRYSPFVRLLRRDGFVISPSRTRFTREALDQARILVIANADSPRQQGAPYIPAPSAFAPDEIEAVRSWVSEGGSLFLIADHLPWGGAAAQLAEAFGLLFSHGYATDAMCGADEFLFERANRTLQDHPITRGRSAAETVNAVRSITGQAFRSINPDTSALLVLASRTVLLLPAAPWQFTDETPRVPAEGMLQERLCPSAPVG